MIICPWCGTNYLNFQPNCDNCGGPLQNITEASSFASSEELPTPPPAPRPISDKYAWRLLSSDGWSIAALIFGILGIVFSVVGAGLTLGMITAFVGIPFLLLGLVYLVASGAVLVWRHNNAQKVVSVLRDGDPTRGQINALHQNFSVRINGRSPWIIGYEYEVGGQPYAGKVSTLNQPGQQLQVGKAVRILYLAAEPVRSSIYPHP